MITPQTEILNYRITRQIGRGGMATVFEAEHCTLKYKVAVKAMDQRLSTDENYRIRFFNEAVLLASFNHPRIAKINNYFEIDNELIIIMEFVEGQTLAEYIANYPDGIEETKAISILIQLLDVLEYAHKKGIVHRDIKPTNIMIDKDGQIKVLDFGIAKLQGQNGFTSTGTKMGSIPYMSPEQVRGQKDITNKSDIYSAGILLYNLLSGKLPYSPEERSEFDIMKSIVEKPLPTIPNISNKLNKIIANATQKKKENRYENCEVFIADLQESINKGVQKQTENKKISKTNKLLF